MADVTLVKVWSSFVAVVIPPNVNQPLVSILTSNCTKEPACLPHVTLLDPFLEPARYDEAVVKLRTALEKVQPFTITVSEFGHFSKKKGSILWVKPVSQPVNALEDLQKACMSVFPFCDEVTKISSSGFQPHITLGKFNKKEEALRQCQLLQKSFTPIQFEVKEINFLFREGKDPYKIRRTIPLGAPRANDIPHFPNIPFSMTPPGNASEDKEDEETVI